MSSTSLLMDTMVSLELNTLQRPCIFHIPYEPVGLADFKEWSHFSQRDMVRILSKGTSTRSFLLRKELPPGMLLIDVMLCSNIPLQHMVQRREAILKALFQILEGFYFGPHHLIMTAFLHFE